MIRRLVALLPMFVFALQAAPRLVLSATSVNAGVVAPGTNGSAQTVEAQNAGTGSLNLTTSSSAAWLSATVGSLTTCKVLTGTCSPINISLATSSLAAGTYTEFITLADPNAVDSPQQIAVTVTIASVPSSVTLYAATDGTGLGQAISYIYPASAVTGAVSTTSGGNWLEFIPQGGFIVNQPNTIQATALVGMGPGTYTGQVKISGSSRSSDNIAIQVTFVVGNEPLIDLTKISTFQMTGVQGGGKVTSYVSFTTVAPSTFPGAGAAAIPPLNITAASAAGAGFTAAVYNSTTIAVTADAGTLAPGIYRAAVTITSNALNNAAVSLPVEFTVVAAGAPSISAGGIVNAATFVSEAVAPGDAVSVFGLQFAAAGTAALNPGLPPLATTLGGAQVLVNGTPAPLYYVSPGQINFQVPYSLAPGSVATVQVMNGAAAGNLRSMTIAANAPRVLVFEGSYGIAVNQDGSFPLPSSISIPGYATHPAKPGDVLVLFAIGFGQTAPAQIEGQATPLAPLENAAATTVTFGTLFGGAVTVNAAFSGLTPTAVGLYQINVQVPQGVPYSSALPVTVTVGGATSNTFMIAVSANGQ